MTIRAALGRHTFEIHVSTRNRAERLEHRRLLARMAGELRSAGEFCVDVVLVVADEQILELALGHRLVVLLKVIRQLVHRRLHVRKPVGVGTEFQLRTLLFCEHLTADYARSDGQH